jgi:hypothetical protein
MVFVPQTRNGHGPTRPDAEGNFVLGDMQCVPAPLQLVRLSDGYYVKEVRVNGVAVANGSVTLCAGSRLEIVLDNKVAALSISATDGDKPASESIIVSIGKSLGRRSTSRGRFKSQGSLQAITVSWPYAWWRVPMEKTRC